MRKPPPAPDPLLRLQASITDRDDRLLGWLYDHGLLTTDQITTALFPSLDFAQRRLRRLTVLRGRPLPTQQTRRRLLPLPL